MRNQSLQADFNFKACLGGRMGVVDKDLGPQNQAKKFALWTLLVDLLGQLIFLKIVFFHAWTPSILISSLHLDYLSKFIAQYCYMNGYNLS